MFHENEEEVMKAPGVCSEGSSCWHMFPRSVRVKTPGSCVRRLQWLHIQLLVVLLAGQASCNQTSTTPAPSSATTNTQTSVHYFVTVEIDGKNTNGSEIASWLVQAFKNHLGSCVSPNYEQTTAPPTSPQTASASTYETTLSTAASTLQRFNTTAAASELSINSTTVAAASTALMNSTTSAAASTALMNSTTSAAASTASTTIITTPAAASPASTTISTTPAAASPALMNSTTSAAASTALMNSTTPAAASPASTTIITTPAATSPASTTISTTPAATSTALTTTSATTSRTNQHNTVTWTQNNNLIVTLTDSTVVMEALKIGEPSENPSPNSNRQRIAREIGDNAAQTRAVGNTAGLLEEIEVNCTSENAVRNNSCIVVLQLKQVVPPCCILRTICTASKTSPDVYVVAKKVDRIRQLQNVCNSNPQEENSCIYNGPAGASCEESGPAYVVPQRNSTTCGVDKQNNCSCSAYCNGTEAFYTFHFSIINDTVMNHSYILSLISKIQQPPNCSLGADVPCPLTIIAHKFKDANVTCGRTPLEHQSCRAILRFAHAVHICDVSVAVKKAFQSERQINYTGHVTRAAICGDAAVSDSLPEYHPTWLEVKLKPANFCMAIEESNNLTCPSGKNVVVLLKEHCGTERFTTPSPYVTAAQPNTNTSNANVTSPPMNATTATFLTTSNATATVKATTTANATTTTATVHANATANTIATTTATTTNPSSVTPSERPTTTESADSQAKALLELTRNVSQLNSSQVDQLVSQLENLLSGPTVSLELGNTSVHIVSSLLGASPETLSASSNRIIGIVDTVALKLVLDQPTETLLSPAVALSVKTADGSNFQETFFSISDPTNVQVRGAPRSRRSVGRDSSIPQGSIVLPPSLTQDLSSEEQQLASRVQFNFYQKSTVFQDRSLGKRKLNSGILGASVANLSITGLQDDVIIHLRNTEPVPVDYVAKCVFWDFTLNNGSGGWNSSGCFVRNSTDNETVCSCNHLTSFAILLDLSREPITSRLQATILTFITYIGCGVSAIFLSVTLLTYLAFGKLRKDIPSKILIQLCLALLLLNLVFLVDAWLALYPDAVGLCISTAWFLHYFLLVAFTWMGLEAVHMYLALVKVFNSYISRYMLKFSLVGWGIPMIVVIVVIAIDKDNYGLVSYGKFSNGTSDDFCWLKNDIAFYVAVVAYFCIIFLFNLIMFVVVLIQLCRIKRQNPHNMLHRTTLQDARSVAGITILLGLTWGFAFFAWGPLNLPFMYLFAIFNSLQGFFIFVFHCAVKENVRRQWRTYLCCGRMRLAENSEWSRTATQKTAKKSSVTRLTSLHSSKSSESNNSSSSSSFLVSDSSEQINGNSSPFEDRTIIADEDRSVDVILNEINSQYRNQHRS